MALAGAVEAIASSFGITLYQYNASMMEQHALAVIHLMVQWHLSTMLLLDSTSAH